MNKSALFLTLCTLPFLASCLTMRDLPSSRYAEAERAMSDAAAARDEALAQYERSSAILGELASEYPEWRAGDVAAAMERCEGALAVLRGSFVGNRASRKVHRIGCRWAQRMKKENRINLSSYDEALRRGFVACKVCRPARAAEKAPPAGKGEQSLPARHGYIAHRDSFRVHRDDCPWAEKILEKNRHYFNTYREAADAGYLPCKVCRPDRDAASAGLPGEKAATAAFIGHRGSRKVHSSDCPWARKISPRNSVFFDSYDAAVLEGYSPCKVCKPGAPSISEKLDSL